MADLQLQATNAQLQAALAEREAIVAALPIGLVAVRGGGSTYCNQEAERLCALARAHGLSVIEDAAQAIGA